MIAEVSKTDTIHYVEFLEMMLGKQSSVLKLILKFEGMAKKQEEKKGPPPKKTLAELTAKK